MEKVYLLLRNNLQSGPFTIHELVDQQLLTSDLIWVEGKSNSWTPPSALEELKPTFTIATDKIKSEAPIINKPVQEKQEEQNLPDVKTIEAEMLEKRAEELKKSILSYKPAYYSDLKVSSNETLAPKTKYQNEDAVEFVFHKKAHNTIIPQVLILCVLIAFIVLSHYEGWSLINQQKKSDDEVAIPLISSSAHTAYNKPKPIVEKGITTIKADTQVVKPVIKLKPRLKSKINQDKKNQLLKKPSQDEMSNIERREDIKTYDGNANTSAATDKKTETVKSDETSSKGTTADISQKNNPTVDPSVKRKTIGQFFKGLFKKKKKEE